jgi:hypothetical protein
VEQAELGAKLAITQGGRLVASATISFHLARTRH